MEKGKYDLHDAEKDSSFSKKGIKFLKIISAFPL